MSLFDSSYNFSRALIADVDEISRLETEGYPADEAASAAQISYRIQNAYDYFWVLKQHARIVGFVNGTCILQDSVHHGSMSHHESEGTTLVIHSVVVCRDLRRQKLASTMLRSYIAEVSKLPRIERILLLMSPVVHGQEKWMELGLDLKEYRGTDQWVVDAFAAAPFSGNPAAVVLTQKSDEWMQKVAMENNYAETSFVKQIEDNLFHLRWFTPACEVELCGHATLAAAHVLYEQKVVSLAQPIRFQTKYSGELVATGTSDMTIELTFPATPVSPITWTAEEQKYFLDAFGFKEADILYSGKSIYYMLVEVTPEAFYSINTVNYSLLEKFGGRGVLVTAAGGKRTNDPNHLPYDFVSRGFFPLYGIPEDPVTGSAHCALSVYWFNKFGIQQTPTVRSVTLEGYQASKRGGAVKVTLLDDRVILGGRGLTTMSAKILV